MRLLLKLNLIFFVVFALALAGTGWVARHFLQETAREHVIQNARIMLETAMAMRSYTTNFVKPLLIDREVVKAPLKADAPTPANVKPEGEPFHPETVPAFAATESFNYLRKKYPSYTYKEATINPTNPRDRTADWEADIVNKFRASGKDDDEVIGQRMATDTEVLFLAHPIKIKDQRCLECHTTPEMAPESMVKLYGVANGFGWKMGEVVGAQVVSVPMALPLAMADRALKALLISLVAVFVVTLLVLNLAIYFFVIRPVVALTVMADAVSKGKTDIQDLPAKGSDEISQMAAAFNRMHRSLSKALKMLGE